MSSQSFTGKRWTIFLFCCKRDWECLYLRFKMVRVSSSLLESLRRQCQIFLGLPFGVQNFVNTLGLESPLQLRPCHIKEFVKTVGVDILKIKKSTINFFVNMIKWADLNAHPGISGSHLCYNAHLCCNAHLFSAQVLKVLKWNALN